MAYRIALTRAGTVVMTLGLLLHLTTGTASAANGVPPPARADRGGVTDCGFISPQQAFVAFYGPERTYLDQNVVAQDGGESSGEKVIGTVALEVFNGGCGLSATVTMQRNTCDEHQSFWDRVRGCGWKDWGEQEFTYDEIPTNGTVIFPAVRSVALEGTHRYRMVVEVSGNRLETVDPQGRFRGALLPSRTSQTHEGPTIRLTN